MSRPSFQLVITNFSGPFELLLDLVAKRELDLTTLALSEVTDEFIAHTRKLGAQFAQDLGAITEFLVVAATLLQLKAARLLPSPEPEDPEALALFEARDVLFAKLLQYRAYREAAAQFAGLMASASRSVPAVRVVSEEDLARARVKPVSIGVGLDTFAKIATAALAPKLIPEVAIGHMHAKPVSVADQAALLLGLLGGRTPGQWWDFAQLVADVLGHRELLVARFLAVLRLHGAAQVELEQDDPLAPLRLRAVPAA